jgi:glycosyltransferase involved in cell wall biosynthesis
MRIQFWMGMPSHHQSEFFEAIRAEGADLQVLFFGSVFEERLRCGWQQYEEIPSYCRYVAPAENAWEELPDWKERIHVVPGYSHPFLRQLVTKLSTERVQWVHWSERAHAGLRWVLSYPLKRWYAMQVNRHALGAFGTGILALRDLKRWGIRVEHLAHLPYSVRVPNPDLPYDSQCREFCGERPAILYLGSLYDLKGVDILVAAYARFRARHPDWVLILAGDDRSGGAYQRQVRDLGIERDVLFRGLVPISDVSAIFKAAQVLVLPSRHDGWGVVLNEAAEMGLALVASTAVGSGRHLIEPGVNGFLFSSGDTSSLATALEGYGESPELARIHGRESRRLAERCNPRTVAKAFLKTLESWQAMHGRACPSSDAVAE